MSALFTIIGREYLQRVRSRSFIFTTLAAPILFLGLAGASGYLAAGAAAPDRGIALVDRTEIMARARLEGVGIRVESVSPGSPQEDALGRRLASGELTGALHLDQRTLAEGVAVWRGLENPSALRILAMRQAVAQVALEVRLGDLDREGTLVPLLEGGRIEVERLAGAGDRHQAQVAGMGVALAGALFLYFVLLVYGTRVLRSVQEEKTVRIVEIVISSVHPWELMLGKILGVGAVGLTQLLIWMTVGALLVAVALPIALPAVGEAGVPMELVSMLAPGGSVLAFFAICFLAGYFIYASLFAAVGAICSTEEEAQQLQVPVVLLVLVPFLFLIPVLDRPDSTLAVWMSLVPFFSPVLMFARVAVTDVPLWQSLLSIGLMFGALLATAWVAGRIYRTGILMQGKRPTVPEIWRWVREG